MPALQSCVHLAIEHPSHLDRGTPLESDVISQTEDDAIAAEVESNRRKADDGLSEFTRIPPGLKGHKLFFHMIKFRQRKYGKISEQHKITGGLNVEVRTRHQDMLLSIDYHRQIQGQIQDQIGEGSTLEKAARVRLDNLGLVQSHSCFANAPERLRRLKARLELQASIGDIHEMQKQSAEAARAMEEDKLRQVLPKAVELFNTVKRIQGRFKSSTSSLYLLFCSRLLLPSQGLVAGRVKC